MLLCFSNNFLSYFSIKKGLGFEADNSRKELLRKQTLEFIQTITTFIRALNSQESKRQDSEFEEVNSSFNHLANTIHNNFLSPQSARQINELDRQLQHISNDLKHGRIEEVVKMALDVGRATNELFLSITKQKTFNN